MRKTIMVGRNLTHQEAVRKAQSSIKVEAINVSYDPKTGKVMVVF